MIETLVETLGAIVLATVGYFVALVRVAPRVTSQDVRRPARLSGPYPNGSVPFTDGPESLALRATRFACAAANHHPRRYDGSWACGYGYVCGRCYMYADPIPRRETEARIAALGDNPDQMAVAAAFGGGPGGARRRP